MQINPHHKYFKPFSSASITDEVAHVAELIFIRTRADTEAKAALLLSCKTPKETLFILHINALFAHVQNHKSLSVWYTHAESQRPPDDELPEDNALGTFQKDYIYFFTLSETYSKANPVFRVGARED